MNASRRFFTSLTAIAASAALAATVCVPAGALSASSSDDTLAFSHRVSFNSYYFNAGDSNSIDITVPFNFRWITSGSPKTYSSELATWLCVVDTDACEATTTTIDSKEALNSDGSANKTALLEAYGFNDVQCIEIVAPVKGQDDYDTASVTIAHRLATVDGVSYDAYMMSISPLVDNNQWGSNVDIGADSAEYSGNHPEWVNKKNHKGFDVAANRVDKVLASYMQTHAGNASAKVTLSVSGFSRGGDIANILGAAYESGTAVGAYGSSSASANTSFDVSSAVRTYDFACSNTVETTAEDTERAQVFNIVNEDDLFTSAPGSSWGFKRYGTDISYAVSENASLANRFKELSGQAYSSLDAKALVSEVTTALSVQSRADLYKTDEYTSVFNKWPIADWNKKEAEGALNGINNLLEELGVSKSDGLSFSDITATADGKGYQFTKRMRLSFILEIVPELKTAYEESGSSFFVKNLTAIENLIAGTPYEKLESSSSVQSVINNTSAVVYPHVSCSCLAICEQSAAEHQHQWGEWAVTANPTYAAEGVRQRVCIYCGETEEEAIDKLEVTVGVTGVVSGIEYAVTNTSKATVSFEGPATSAAKKAKTVTVPATIKLYSKNYTVASISAKALASSKATTLVINNPNITAAALAKAIEGSSVKTIKVKAYSNSSKNKALAKKYTKLFSKNKALKGVKVTSV